MSLSNSSNSLTYPDPSLQFCDRMSVQTADTSGMHGMVCRVSSPPAYLNFSSCCVGQWRVRDNCTQYCEVEDARAFGDCVNNNPDARNGSDWWRNDTNSRSIDGREQDSCDRTERPLDAAILSFAKSCQGVYNICGARVAPVKEQCDGNRGGDLQEKETEDSAPVHRNIGLLSFKWCSSHQPTLRSLGPSTSSEQLPFRNRRRRSKGYHARPVIAVATLRSLTPSSLPLFRLEIQHFRG
jgi:hypothetical protein